MSALSKSASTEVFMFKSDGFDREIYANVAMSAKLRELALADSAFSAKIEELRTLRGEDYKLIHEFGGECLDFAYDAETGIAWGNYVWSVELRKSKAKLLKLKCRYLLVYSNLKGYPEEYVKIYFEKVGKFASYPYFRSVFASNVSFAGLSLPPLPSLTERVD